MEFKNENAIYYLENETRLTKSKSFEFMNLLKEKKEGEKIDPLEFQTKLKITPSDVFLSFMVLKKRSIVDCHHELFCPRCKFKHSKKYKSISEFKHGVRCHVCDNELTIKESKYIFHNRERRN